jgi:proteasome lid subunit RPN8/RPN11
VERDGATGIRLENGTAHAIRSHAAATYPDECCGAILGRAEGGGKSVVAVLRIDNARSDSARNRFLVADRDYLRAEAEAAARGLDLIGFYHSHPDHPARPSRYDLEHAFPAFSYVIVAVVAGRPERMTSWTLEEDRRSFRAESLEEAAAPQRRSRGARP